MDILTILKALLGIADDSRDALLMVHIDMAIQDALNYCNILELPDDLNFTIARMARLSYSGALSGGISVGAITAPVSSVSEAGRTVSFATSASSADDAKEKEQTAITTQLNRFRRVYRG